MHQDLNAFTFSAPMHSFQLPCYNFVSPYNTLPWYKSCLCNCIPFIKIYHIYVYEILANCLIVISCHFTVTGAAGH